MTNDKDKILIRAKDITLLISIVTLLGFLMGPAKKIFKAEAALEEIQEMKKDITETRTSLAVTNARYQDIQEQLKQINWQLRSMSRNNRRNNDGE